MTTDELIRTAEDIEIPEAFDISVQEIRAVRDYIDGDTSRGIAVAYCMGYIRGQEAREPNEGGVK